MYCPECFAKIEQKPTGRRRKYCSDRCRARARRHLEKSWPVSPRVEPVAERAVLPGIETADLPSTLAALFGVTQRLRRLALGAPPGTQVIIGTIADELASALRRLPVLPSEGGAP
jgi:hypothetical protein